MKTLFETVVGSHAWKMNTPKSDIDIFQVYQVPTKDILSGILRQNSHFTSGEDKDESRHEIGVVIEQLIKGNFNFVIGVCSPIVNEDKYGYLKELREITERNLAKNIYHSTRGLAMHNYRKYFINNGIKMVSYINGEMCLNENKRIYSEDELQKKRNLIVRSLIFGATILHSGKIDFRKIQDQRNKDVDFWLKEIKWTYEDSKLPETPDPTEFREFLYNIRIAELEGKNMTREMTLGTRSDFLFGYEKRKNC